MSHPGRIVEIPLHGLSHAGLETFPRRPAQFAFDLAGIDGIALVVAGAVSNRDLLLAVAFAISTRLQVVEQGAQGTGCLFSLEGP